MFEKIKLWMLTDENRQKRILELEKEERQKNRNKDSSDSDLKSSSNKTNTKSKDKKSKGKKDKKVKGKGKKGEVTPAPKKKVYKTIVTTDEEKREGNSLPLEDLNENKLKLNKEEPISDNNSFEDIHKKLQDIENQNKNKKVESKADPIEKVKDVDSTDVSESLTDDVSESLTDNISESLTDNVSEPLTDDVSEPLTDIEDNSDSQDDITLEDDSSELTEYEIFLEKQRKEELVKKKLEEKDRYLDIRLSFPPTDDNDKIIQWCLEAGIPEWYLREEKIIVDDSQKLSRVENLTVGVKELRENADKEARLERIEAEYKIRVQAEEMENSIINLMNNSDVNRVVNLPESIDNTDNTDLIADSNEEVSDEVIVSDTVDFFESDGTDNDREVDSIDLNDNIEINLIDTEDSVESDSIDVSGSVDVTDESSIDTSDKVYVNDSVDLLNSVEDMDSVEDDSIELSEDVSVEVGTDDSVSDSLDDSVEVIPPSSLESRLKNIANHRTKSVALNVTGANIFVKEEKEDEFGNKQTNYKNYKVDTEDAKKIVVGEEMENDIVKEHIIPKTIIDGEEYTVSEDEEKEILKDLIRREIWIITDNQVWVDNLNKELKESRYFVYSVKNERDFLLATRSIDNTIVITQVIPSSVKSSIASYLKYLDEEKKRARLVTIEDSPVKARVIEHIFPEISYSELEDYYSTFDSSLYNKSSKSVDEVLKAISFNLEEAVSSESSDVVFEDEDEELNLDNNRLVDLGDGEILLDLDLENQGLHEDIDLNKIFDISNKEEK